MNLIGPAPPHREEFERIQSMRGANRLFTRIARTPTKDQMLDYLAEVQFALVFAGLGFQVTIEPWGYAGPDLEIAKGERQAVVEVKRFRNVNPGPPELNLDKDLSLKEYGNPRRDIRKAIQKITEKFRQIGEKKAIIAIWNDDGDMEEIEVKTAVNMISDDPNSMPPKDLLFVLYGSPWRSLKDGKQLYCFPLQKGIEGYQEKWQTELEVPAGMGSYLRCSFRRIEFQWFLNKLGARSRFPF